MTTDTLTRYEIDVEDVEYLRHGDKPLLARSIHYQRPASPQAKQAIDRIIEFVHRELR